MSCVELRTRLIFDKFRETSVETTDTGGVLGGKCCDDTRPMVVQRGKRLRVRLKRAQESVNLSKVLSESRVDPDPSTLPKGHRLRLAAREFRAPPPLNPSF
jgi:hypothetical protein